MDVWVEKSHRAGGNVPLARKQKKRLAWEAVMRAVFTVCAAFAVSAVLSMALYMAVCGLPAAGKLGLGKILFGTVWKPVAAEPEYGIWYIILTSLTGTVIAVLMGVPAGILTAIFLTDVSGKRTAGIVKPAVELLAGVPSVIYGMLGLYLLNPWIYRLERKLFGGSEAHQFTGGANLLAAVLVLAVMILPTVINVSESAIRAVHPGIREASLALGASRVQTVFRAVLPAARSGIATAAVLGAGRALGEAMAVVMVSGNCVNPPLPFRSVRFLTTAIVSEMAYAQGTHRQMLFTIGLVLAVFVMMVQIVLNRIMREE